MTTRTPQWLPRPVGVDRPGDPVLTMTAEQRAVLLDTVYWGWSLTGVANAPVGRALTDRRLHPRPGDLVIIPDAMSRRTSSAGNPLMGVGYLLATRREPAIGEQEWAEDGQTEWAGNCPEEQVWYVQYGPAAGDVCRWENASCHAVPRGGAFADEIQEAASRSMGGVRW